ncbi:hypothetical protein FSP39_004036 [Pinctada imbricata]|uniref:BZIP domain-containing protein n=1 Tax=Pinctada imbricata TaxID=66713 RepID=A0AA88XXZ7_PINIB|nr:hypothetical protein FSP39_004036 [Pinctada imbricata]
MMDFIDEFSSINTETSEHSLFGDLSKEVYATSPNSSFLYEQEKADMQNSLGKEILLDSQLRLNEDFDLSARYETSTDLCMLQNSRTSTNTLSDVVRSSVLDNSEDWQDKFMKQGNDFALLPSSDILEPTLAELNTHSEENSLIEIGSTNNIQNTDNLDFFRTIIATSAENNLRGKCQETEILNSKTNSLWTNQSPIQSVRTATSTLSNTFAPPVRNLANLTFQNKNTGKIVNGLTTSSCIPSTVTSITSQAGVGDESNSVDRKWEEIKHFIHDDLKQTAKQQPRPALKRKSQGSLSSALSNDTDDGSDTDMNEDTDSDVEESDDEWSGANHTSSKRACKDQQYFWQYNIQLKGPKGKRVNFGLERDPHKLQDFEDPVFDSNTATQLGTAIRHGGKARKGDGNDIRPNPKKLVQIGTQLKKINKQINEFVPLSELPLPSRNKSKKEKNKLASRACRLKKKAQHEANKVKLHGLDLEHKQLLQVVTAIRNELFTVVNDPQRGLPSQLPSSSMTEKLEGLIKENIQHVVAGNSADFVNGVIKRVEEGDPTGGLDISRNS